MTHIGGTELIVNDQPKFGLVFRWLCVVLVEDALSGDVRSCGNEAEVKVEPVMY